MSISVSTPSAQVLFSPAVQFLVPPYQRRYRWTEEEQWDPLWEDVRELAEQELDRRPMRESDVHFFGALVLSQRPNAGNEPVFRQVIDGQQRLTTLQLLIDSAEHELRLLGHDRAPFLEQLILNDKRIYASTFHFKVRPTRADQAAFEAAMDNSKDTTLIGDSKIVAAHEFFAKSVRNWLQDEHGALLEDWYERGKALVDVIQNRLVFVQIDINDDGLANGIFETLNARGTPLGAWDLVKNHIYSESSQLGDFDDWFSETLLKFDDDWWQDEQGSGRNRKSHIDLLVFHFIVLRTRREVKGRSSTDLFRSFQGYLREPDEESEKGVRGIGTDLSTVGDVYRSELVERPRVSEVDEMLHRWKVSGQGVFTPVFLWLFSNEVSESQIARAVSALDGYLVRRMILQSSTKDYSELARGLLGALHDGNPDDAGETVLAYLRKRAEGVATLAWPSDEELRECLIDRRLYGRLTVPRVRVLLDAIERRMRAKSGVAEAAAPQGEYWIEHVMPSKWHAHWPAPVVEGEFESPEQRRDRILHSIGNLTLIGRNLNIKLKNSAWQTKKSLLQEHSKLYLSNDLLEHSGDWDEEAIQERSEHIAQIALDIWPGPNKF